MFWPAKEKVRDEEGWGKGGRYTWVFSHTFSGRLQLTHDPQLSQGLTVDEKSAYLRGTQSVHEQAINREPAVES
jgi:hypothetical protein